jgi:hypothetical protein
LENSKDKIYLVLGSDGHLPARKIMDVVARVYLRGR